LDGDLAIVICKRRGDEKKDYLLVFNLFLAIPCEIMKECLLMRSYLRMLVIGIATLFLCSEAMADDFHRVGLCYYCSPSPHGISADGSVVVGDAYFDEAIWGFRWTEREGLVGIHELGQDDYCGQARGVSADGSVVVGDSGGCMINWNPREAFLWTKMQWHGWTRIFAWQVK
jgi:hypothetical protein